MAEIIEPVVNRSVEVVALLCSTLFFFACYFAARRYVNSVRSLHLTELKVHELLNVIVSFIHSSLESVFVISLLYLYEHNQAAYASLVRLWVVFFIGYNVYDTISCGFHNFYIFRLVPQLIPHHVLIIGSFIFVLFTSSELMHYFLIGTLCEIHSVNLHIRNILRLIKPHYAWLRWPNELLNSFNFLAFRYSSSTWLVYQGIVQQDTHGWLWWFLPAILLVINTMMMYHLVCGYIRDYRKAKRGQSDTGNLGDKASKRE